MRQAGRVIAGLCAAVLTLSLSACYTGAGPSIATAATATPAASTPAAAGPGTVTTVRATRAERRLGRRVRLPSQALAAPDAIAVAGTRIWVANSRYEDGGGGWLTELSATTGALVRIVAGGRYALTDPQALAVDGDRLWVADGNGDALTELSAATGALIRVIAARRYQLADPAALAVDGGGLWVANGASNSVTELDAVTGALIRVISAPRYRLNTTVYAPAIAAAGNRVWVPDGNTDAVTEIDAATGALVRVIAGRRYQLNGPDAIVAAGSRVWVVNVNTPSVTEIDAATGALIRVIASLPNVPFAITADRGGVWLVTNLGEKAVDGAGPHGSVAEFSAGTGRRIRNITGAPFGSDSPGGAIAADGGDVWVTDTNFYSDRGWVAGLSAATGALVRLIVS